MSEPFDYAQINEKILEAVIGSPKATAGTILSSLREKISRWPVGRDQGRVIDGQLQKLKRDGKIGFINSAWQLKS